MMKNKKALVMSVLCAVASVGFVVSASAAEQAIMCYNLTGKDYWIAYGSGLHLSSPRTFMLSAQFDL